MTYQDYSEFAKYLLINNIGSSLKDSSRCYNVHNLARTFIIPETNFFDRKYCTSEDDIKAFCKDDWCRIMYKKQCILLLDKDLPNDFFDYCPDTLKFIQLSLLTVADYIKEAELLFIKLHRQFGLKI